MANVKKYGHWVIFRDFGAMTGRTYWSALQEDNYKAAERGEFRIPYRDLSKRELIKLLDRVDDQKGIKNPDRDYDKYPINYGICAN